MDNIFKFDDDGKLFLDHECETCFKFPLEDLNDPCLACGITQIELIQLEKNINRMNNALDYYRKMGQDDEDIDVRQAHLHLSAISLGDGFDQIVLTDIDQTDDIRGLADIAEHMCDIVIYPTNIRHVEGDEYEEYEDDDE